MLPRLFKRKQIPYKPDGDVPVKRSTEVYREDPVASVLDYIMDNLDRHLSYSDIARGSEIQVDKVGRIVRELEKEGAIVRTETRSRHGSKYRINSGGPNSGGKVTSETSIFDEVEITTDFVNITNSLVWQFIRETRATDVLLFITWLERNADGK